MGSQFSCVRERGKIIFDNRRTAIACTVRERSAYAAKLEVAEPRSVPMRFDLLVEGEAHSRGCVLREVVGNQLSIIFTDKPAQQAATPLEFGRKQAGLRRETRDEGDALATLDKSESGLVIVDADLRATAVNRAFRQLSSLPDALSESCPPLHELLRASALRDWGGELVDQVRRGDSNAFDVRLSGGEGLRVHCVPLPGGRHLLSFVKVTDYIRRVDELEVLRAAIDSVEQGVVIMDADLIVRFVNKRARDLWRLTGEQCDHKPTFAQFLYDIAATGIYDIPDDQLEDYVISRYATVQAGDATPIDICIKGDRIVRALCTALPDGGRMITHTDVTDLVRRAQYHEQIARTDALTGIPNRRAFLELAEAELDRYSRYSQPFTVLCLDVDNLKQINDRLGHEGGDRAIAEVARICSAEKRSSDVIARIGGDEFAVLMPGTTADVAKMVAARLRGSVAQQAVMPEDVQLSVCTGIAECREEGETLAALLKRADAELYAAKRETRKPPETHAPDITA
jgi:diguanylate cyclase (GGDEF)-like protein